jgi:hypothetical protein
MPITTAGQGKPRRAESLFFGVLGFGLDRFREAMARSIRLTADSIDRAAFDRWVRVPVKHVVIVVADPLGLPQKSSF